MRCGSDAPHNMKQIMKKIVFALAMLLTMVSCSHEYKITVTFPDDADVDGKTAYLTNYDSGDTIDSVVIAHRCCVLQGVVDTAYMGRLLANGQRITFVVEPGDIELTMAGGYACKTPLNDRFNHIDGLLASIDADSTRPQQVKDSLMANVYMHAYVDNRENAIGPWALNSYIANKNFTEAQIDSLMSTAPQNYGQFKRLRKAREQAHRRTVTAVGQKMLDFEVPAADGSVQRLSDYVGRGKVCLVDFWASWCPPCRAEIPNLLKMKAEYAPRLTVVGVAVWDNPADTRRAIAELNIDYPVITGTQNLQHPTDLYGINAIPHIIIFDADGTIVSRGLTGEALAAKLQEILKK